MWKSKESKDSLIEKCIDLAEKRQITTTDNAENYKEINKNFKNLGMKAEREILTIHYLVEYND